MPLSGRCSGESWRITVADRSSAHKFDSCWPHRAPPSRSLGGGWIGAFGSHAIDLIRWLLGDIVRAGATTSVTVIERPDAAGTIHRCDAEDAFTGWAELRSGAAATVDSSFVAAVSLVPRIVVLGSEGAIENIGDARVIVRRSDGSTEQFEFEPRGGDPHNEAMTAWAAAIRDSVLSGEPIGPSFADGLACMEVMEQWRASPSPPATLPIS